MTLIHPPHELSVRSPDPDLLALLDVAGHFDFGAGLDKLVVAEGIETAEQAKLVTELACHEGQGYFFGRPMSAKDIHARLEARTPEAQRVA